MSFLTKINDALGLDKTPEEYAQVKAERKEQKAREKQERKKRKARRKQERQAAKDAKREAIANADTGDLLNQLDENRPSYFEDDSEDARATAAAKGFPVANPKTKGYEIPDSGEKVPIPPNGFVVRYQRKPEGEKLLLPDYLKFETEKDDPRKWSDLRTVDLFSVDADGGMRFSDVPLDVQDAILAIWDSIVDAFVAERQKYANYTLEPPVGFAVLYQRDSKGKLMLLSQYLELVPNKANSATWSKTRFANLFFINPDGTIRYSEASIDVQKVILSAWNAVEVAFATKQRHYEALCANAKRRPSGKINSVDDLTEDELRAMMKRYDCSVEALADLPVETLRKRYDKCFGKKKKKKGQKKQEKQKQQEAQGEEQEKKQEPAPSEAEDSEDTPVSSDVEEEFSPEVIAMAEEALESAGAEEEPTEAEEAPDFTEEQSEAEEKEPEEYDPDDDRIVIGNDLNTYISQKLDALEAVDRGAILVFDMMSKGQLVYLYKAMQVFYRQEAELTPEMTRDLIERVFAAVSEDGSVKKQAEIVEVEEDVDIAVPKEA